MTKIAIVLFVLCALASVSTAQFIWNETFTYGTSGDLTSAVGTNWGEYNSGSTNIQLGSGSITFIDYPESGSGNHIILNGDGQGVHRAFSTVGPAAGTKIYLSFMIDISAAPTSAAEFATFETNPLSGENYATLLVKEGSTTGQVQFALKKNAITSTLSSFTGDYPEGIHLIVISYEFVSGSSNDVSKLWVDPDLTGTEPTPTITWNDNIATDAGGIGNVVFFTPTGMTTLVAGLRLATAWADTPLPVQLTNFAATSSRFGVDLQWSTETELSNYGFEIERRKISQMSADTRGFESGNDVSSDWNTVGFVQGAGTSTSPREYSYTDANVEPGRYAYRIKQIDLGGAFTYYSAAEVEVGLGPKELALEPNYPNPFNPSTNITFTVPVDGRAALKVYNMLGQEVAILFDEEAVAGRVYQKTFDASSLPTGVYVSRLEFGGQSVMRKMLFVK